MLDQGVISLSNFIIAIIVAKALGVNDFGIYAMCLLSIQFLASIHQSIIIKPLLSLYPEKSLNDESFILKMNSIHFIFLGVASLLFFSTVFVMSFFFHEYNSVMLLFLLTALALSVVTYDYLRRVLVVTGEYSKLLTMDLFSYGILVIMFFSYYSLDIMTIENVLMNNTFVFVFIATFTFISTKQKFQFNQELIALFIDLWNYSKYLVLTSLLQWFSGNLFILVAGILLGPISLGVVRIAQTIMGVFNALFLALENIVPLRAAYIFRDNKKLLNRYFVTTTAIYIVPIILLIALIVLFNEELIGLIFGSSYTSYGFVIVAFALIYLLVYTNTMQQFYIRTIRANQILFKSYLASTIFGLLFSKMIVSSYGLYGVIAGIFVSQLIVNSVNFFLIRKEIK